MKMRFYDFKRLLLSVLPIGLMAVCILFLDSCARDNPTVHRDEENENQNYFTSGQSGGTPFCDDSSKCIVFKPRTGEYSYEKAPLVLQLPKNLGKYAFMTGLVTTVEVRSIKIFVDEAIFDKGSGNIKNFLSIFSVSGTKKESSLLSLSAINDSPIPMTRLDFSLDENDEDDEDFTYVHVKDTPDERYIEDKIKAYKAALKGELDSGAHEEEAKKLQEGLAWLNKGSDGIRDEVAKKGLDALIEKMKREYLKHVTVTDLYATEEKRIDSETYKELFDAVEDAEGGGVKYLQPKINRLFADKNIVDTSTFLAKMTEEIVAKELADKIAVLKNGVNSVESENPVLAKDIIELSDTYKKTKGFITDIETDIANNVVDNSVKLGEVDRFITSMSNVGAADGSKIDGTIRDEIKQGLSDKMTAQVARVEGWKDAIDKEALSVEELATSDTYGDVDEFITTVKGSVVLTKRDSVNDYVARFGKYTTFIADLEANDVDSAPTFVSKVYEEMLDDRLSIFRDYENAGTDVVRDKYGIMRIPEFLPLSPTYVALAEMRLEWIQLREGKNYEEGYNRSSVEMKDLEDAGIHTTEEFATKVIEEIVKELTDRLAILKSGVNSVESENPSIAKDIIELSDTYTKTKGFITDIETDIETMITNGVGGHKANLEAIDSFISSMSNVGAADGSKIDETIRDEIKQDLSDKMVTQFAIVKGWLDAVDREGLSVEELATSYTYVDVGDFITTVKGSVVLTKRDSVSDCVRRFGVYTTFIADQDANDVYSARTFVSRVYKEMLDARLSIFRDYKNAGTDVVKDKYGIMRIPEFLPLSPTYVALDHFFDDMLGFMLRNQHEEWYKSSSVKMKDLEDAGIHTTEEFATKVIEEVRAAGDLTDRLTVLKNGVDPVENDNPSIAKDIIELSDTYTKTKGFITDIEILLANGVVDNSAKLGEVDSFISSMSNEGVADGSKIDGTIRDEIKQGLSDRKTAQVARVEGSKLIGDELVKKKELNALIEKAKKDISDFIEQSGASSDFQDEIDRIFGLFEDKKITDPVTLENLLNKALKEYDSNRLTEIWLRVMDGGSREIFDGGSSSSDLLELARRETFFDKFKKLLKSIRKDYLKNAGITDKYPNEEERKLSSTYRAINTLYEDADSSMRLYPLGVEEERKKKYYRALLTEMKDLEDAGIHTMEQFATKVIEEIEAKKQKVIAEVRVAKIAAGELTDRLTVLKSGVNSVESENPSIAKDIIELSDTYTKTIGFITDIETDIEIDIETDIANNVVDNSVKLGEVDRFITSMSNVGAADGSKIDGTIRDEIKQGLSDKMTAQVARVEGWKDAIDKEALSVEELDTSDTYGDVDEFITTVKGSVVLTKRDSVNDYVARFGKYTTFIADLEANDVDSAPTFVSKVYQEILADLLTNTKSDYIDNTEIAKAYPDKKERLLSTTYSEINTAVTEAEASGGLDENETGYTTLSRARKTLETNGVSNPTDFSTTVIREIGDEKAIGVLQTEIVGLETDINTALGELIAWKDAVEGEAINAKDLDLSNSHTEVTDLIASEGIPLAENSPKSEYVTRKTNLDTLKTNLKTKGATDSGTYIELVYQEILDELLVSTRKDYIDNTGITGSYTEIEREFSVKYRGINTAFKAADASVVLKNHATGYANLLSGMDKLANGGIKNPADFVREVSLEIEDEKKIKREIDVLKTEITTALNKLKDWRDAVDAKNIQNLDLSQSHTDIVDVIADEEVELPATSVKSVYETRKQNLEDLKDELEVKTKDEYIELVYREVLSSLLEAVKTGYLNNPKVIATYKTRKKMLERSPLYKAIDMAVVEAEALESQGKYEEGYVRLSAGIGGLFAGGVDEFNLFLKNLKEMKGNRKIMKRYIKKLRREYIDGAEIKLFAKSDRRISKAYNKLRKAFIAGTKDSKAERFEEGYKELKAKVDAMQFADGSAFMAKVTEEIGDVIGVEVDEKIAILDAWLSLVEGKISKGQVLNTSKRYKEVKDFKKANPKPSAVIDYRASLVGYTRFINDKERAGITTADTFNREVYRELLKAILIDIKNNYMFNAIVENVYKTEGEKVISKSYRNLKEAVDVAKAEQTANRYEVGYTALKAVVDAMKFTDATELLNIIQAEIGGVRTEINKKVDTLNTWLSFVAVKITKATTREFSDTYTKVRDFKRLNPKPILLRNYAVRLGNYITFMADMKKAGITTADTFNRKVDQEIESALQDRVETFKRDYTENARIIGLYATEQGRELSSVYKAINTAVKEGESFIKQGLYVAADARLIAGMDDLVDDAINVPDKFEKKVIEEIEAAVLSGKVITKREGVVDYIVSSFYSFIDRLIESRDKIKNTDRETVKVFQGNVAGGNDLGLDLDVLKEEASWGNFSRFKGFVEAGGWAYLQDVKVDFSYTQKDAGLKLSCKNSSFFMTKEEFWLKAKSGDRGINLGDFKTPDMYNCDLSSLAPAVGNPEVEKRSKRSIKFRVKGVNIAAADESKLDNLGDLDTLIKNGFLFSEIAQEEILEFKKVKRMPVVDVEIIVLDTASFEEKCKEIGCNVDVDPEVVQVVPPLVLGGEKVAILFKGEDNFTDFALRY